MNQLICDADSSPRGDYFGDELHVGLHRDDLDWADVFVFFKATLYLLYC